MAADESDSRDDGVSAIRIDDLLIDEATGEVLEWPAGMRGERVEYLTRRCVEAQAAMKAWEVAYNAYLAALGKMLTDAGVRSIKTAWGTPSLRSRTDRRGRPERVPKVAARYELSPQQVQAIWMCASALDAKQIQALADDGVLPPEAADDLIEVKTFTWVVVMPAKLEPPLIERTVVDWPPPRYDKHGSVIRGCWHHTSHWSYPASVDT